jgi:hypothetical protein
LEKDLIQNVGTVDRVTGIIAGTALIGASVLGYIGACGSTCSAKTADVTR